MKTTVKIEQEVDIKKLIVSAQVRYWEDADVNGIEDIEGALIPCREGDNWCPEIDIDNGVIINWKKGIKASVHYKVCDAGTYMLQDENNKTILAKEGYVPNIMSPKENGFGDYIIMDIDENGKIDNWNPNITDLLYEEN